jgi:hypothetical protein
MFSYYYNYIFFFCNYELLVMVCFFSFLFFLFISDQGALGSYLLQLSQDARSKIERHLEARENMIQELSLSLASTERNIRKMLLQGSFDTSRDALLALQHIVKKLSRLHITMQTKYRLDGILL